MALRVNPNRDFFFFFISDNGNKEIARNWMLQLEGTLMNEETSFPPVQLQVVVCLRDTNRLRKSQSNSNLVTNENPGSVLSSNSESSGNGSERPRRKRSSTNDDSKCDRTLLEDQYFALKMARIKAELPSLPLAVLQWKISELKKTSPEPSE